MYPQPTLQRRRCVPTLADIRNSRPESNVVASSSALERHRVRSAVPGRGRTVRELYLDSPARRRQLRPLGFYCSTVVVWRGRRERGGDRDVVFGGRLGCWDDWVN